jgi:hypothetical protein
MKKIFSIILPVAVISMLLASCDSIESLFDVDFKTTLSGDLNVEVQEAGKKAVEAYPFSAYASIDPTADPDIQEYLEKIVNVTADSVIAEVVSVNKDDVVFLAGTSITISDDESSVTWTIMNDWPIVVGTTVKLDDVGGLYDAVSDILTNLREFEVSIEGTCSQTGVSVTIRIDIDTTVTGNPL